MTYHFPSSPFHFFTEWIHVGSSQKFFSAGVILPLDVKDSSQALIEEHIDGLVVSFIHFPCFTSVQQDWFY